MTEAFMSVRGVRSARRRGAAAALAACLVLGTPGSRARAAFNSGSAGTTAGEFLKLAPDARGAALGTAMGAAAEDATALYWNPAGLAELTQRHVTLTHTVYLQSAYYDFLAYGHPVEAFVARRRRELLPSGLGTLGFGVLYLNAGALEERDNTGQATGGRFTPRDVAVLAGWGGSLTRSLELGLAIKYVDSRIQSVASTGAVDGGLRLKLRLMDAPVVISASAHNLGGTLRFREESFRLPAVYRAGLSLRLLPRWLLAAQGEFPREQDPNVSGGTEVEFRPSEDVSFALRAGFSTRTRRGLASPNGLSAGAGAVYSGFGLDYAWSPLGELGVTHRVSLSYRF